MLKTSRSRLAPFVPPLVLGGYFLASASVEAATLSVPASAGALADAVDRAASGDTLQLQPGEHALRKALVIEKDLSIELHPSATRPATVVLRHLSRSATLSIDAGAQVRLAGVDLRDPSGSSTACVVAEHGRLALSDVRSGCGVEVLALGSAEIRDASIQVSNGALALRAANATVRVFGSAIGGGDITSIGWARIYGSDVELSDFRMYVTASAYASFVDSKATDGIFGVKGGSELNFVTAAFERASIEAHDGEVSIINAVMDNRSLISGISNPIPEYPISMFSTARVALLNVTVLPAPTPAEPGQVVPYFAAVKSFGNATHLEVDNSLLYASCSSSGKIFTSNSFTLDPVAGPGFVPSTCGPMPLIPVADALDLSTLEPIRQAVDNGQYHYCNLLPRYDVKGKDRYVGILCDLGGVEKQTGGEGGGEGEDGDEPSWGNRSDSDVQTSIHSMEAWLSEIRR